MTLTLANSEKFGNVQCDFWRNENGDVYMTIDQLARALGYAGRDGIEKMIERNPYLLEPEFSTTDKLSAVEGRREVRRERRIFTEDGIYEVTMLSRTPKSREFRVWVREVIKKIRKYGVYMTPQKIEEFLQNPDTIIKIAEKWKEEQQKRIAAEKKLEEQKPLVGFAQSCLASERSILVREVAKLASKQGIVIGERRLYRKLREWGLILQTKNEPSQRAMELGLFEVQKGVYQTPTGTRDFATPKVTPKGQMYIINRLRRERDESGGLGQVLQS